MQGIYPERENKIDYFSQFLYSIGVLKPVYALGILTLFLTLAPSSFAAEESGHSSVRQGRQPELPDLAPSRMWAEVDAGQSSVSRPWQLRGSGQSRSIDTYWVEVKLRPMAAEYGWQAVGMHLGTQQSDDVGIMIACRDFGAIAGRRFCAKAPGIYNEGARLMAFYGGFHAELVEIATSEPRPLQFYLGAGATRLQAVALESQVNPYSSFEVLYTLPDKANKPSRLSARASMFMTFLDDRTKLTLSAPSLSVVYRF